MKRPKFSKEIIIHSFLILFSSGLVIGLVYYLISYYLNVTPLPTNADNLGTFGDYIGGVLNPTIAGLALIWLIYSVSLQITELRKTNEALASTLETAKQQQQQISIQNFENLFFELLKVKSDATNEIVYRSAGDISGAPPLQGKAAIEHYISQYKISRLDWEPYYRSQLLDVLGSYFRICYQIVKLIDNNKTLESLPKIENKSYSYKQKEYFDLFRSTLTQSELEAFFFNCLSSFGNKKFKLLIEKYGLFEPLLLKYNYQNEKNILPIKHAYKYDRKIFENNSSWQNYFTEVDRINIEMETLTINSVIKIVNSFINRNTVVDNRIFNTPFSTLKTRIEEYIKTNSSFFTNLEDFDSLPAHMKEAYRLQQSLKTIDFTMDIYLIMKYEIDPEELRQFRRLESMYGL